MTIFAERLKTLRERRGLMQKSVAAELNIGNTTLSNYEKNVSSPSPDILVAIADYFDTSTDYLLGRVSLKYDILSYSSVHYTWVMVRSRPLIMRLLALTASTSALFNL